MHFEPLLSLLVLYSSFSSPHRHPRIISKMPAAKQIYARVPDKMSKRKLFEDVDEMFVENPQWSSETKIVGFESGGFLSKIETREEVKFPNFSLGGFEFYIRVRPNNKKTGFIRVDLMNDNDEDLTMSLSLREGSGVETEGKMGPWRL